MGCRRLATYSRPCCSAYPPMGTCMARKKSVVVEKERMTLHSQEQPSPVSEWGGKGIYRLPLDRRKFGKINNNIEAQIEAYQR